MTLLLLLLSLLLLLLLLLSLDAIDNIQFALSYFILFDRNDLKIGYN